MSSRPWSRSSTPGEPWDVAWSAQGFGFPDPAGSLFPLVGGPEYEARVIAANRMTDAAARVKAWAELEKDLMLNDPPVAVYADVTYRALVAEF